MHRETAKPSLKSHNPHDAEENGGKYDNDKKSLRKEPMIKRMEMNPKTLFLTTQT